MADGRAALSVVVATVAATFNYTLSQAVVNPVTGVTSVITRQVTASANGPLDATVAATKSARTLSTATTIIQGTALLNVSEGQVAASGDPVIVSIITLSVSGFKQSDTAPTSTTTTTTSGG